MNFGEVIEELKKGSSAYRQGWNGKNMFIYLNKGALDFSNLDRTSDYNEGDLIEGVSVNLFESWDKGVVTRLPNINMQSAFGNTVTGWLASQTDILAEDWYVFKEFKKID